MTAPAAPVGWYASALGLAQRARRHWPSLTALSLVGATTAGILAFVLPTYYTATAAFQAEPSAGAPLSSSLAGLAAQFGAIQLPGQSNPQLFADILTTDVVLRRVARATYPWSTGTAGLAVVYGYDRESPAWRDYHTVRKLRRAISIDVNVRTSVVSFAVEARTPELAVALVDTALVALDEANIALRRARAAAEQSFTADRAEHARQELADAEANLAGFYERNRTIASSPSLQIEEGRLRRSVDVAQQVFVQLRLQEEQAAVQAVRNTPAITVIDPAVQPVKPSWPRKKLAIAAGFLCGLLLGIARLTLLP